MSSQKNPKIFRPLLLTREPFLRYTSTVFCLWYRKEITIKLKGQASIPEGRFEVSLEERLLKDMKEALRKQDKGRLSAIRMVRAAAKNKEIELRKKLSDEDIIGVLVSVAKKHKDSIEKFKAGGRDDLVKKEEEELTVVQSYLPKPLKEKELAELIEAVIVEVGAEGKANPGRVMSVIIPRVKGRADGALVNKMVRERLEAKSEAG